MVEYSAPNTNKPLHLGHLRNNVLGWSVSRAARLLGHRVTRINLVNDRGVHICKSMLAYRRWGEGTTPERAGKKGDHLVGDFYVLFDRHLSEEYAAWQQSARPAARLADLAGEQGRARRGGRGDRRTPPAPAPRRLFFEEYKDQYFNTESALGAEVRELLRRWEDGDPRRSSSGAP